MAVELVAAYVETVWPVEGGNGNAPDLERMPKDSRNNVRDCLMRLEVELMALWATRHDTRVAIYARVSTVNHGQDASMQTRGLRLFVEVRGLNVAGEYIESGVTRRVSIAAT